MRDKFSSVLRRLFRQSNKSLAIIRTRLRGTILFLQYGVLDSSSSAVFCETFIRTETAPTANNPLQKSKPRRFSLETSNAFNALHAGLWLPLGDQPGIRHALLHGGLGDFFKRRRGALSAVGGPGDHQPSNGFHNAKARKSVTPFQLNFTAVGALKRDTAGFLPKLAARTPIHRLAPSL